MKTIISTVLLLITVLMISSCNTENAVTDTNLVAEKSAFLNTEDCTDSIFTTTIADLSEADIAGLLLMREEEKLAKDVYVYFYEKYDLTIFDRISKSETKHAEAVLRLLNHFELSDPMSTEAGVFANEELQSLYNELIAIGDDSAEAALAVGALIEETDIEDLQVLLDATANADITTVYGKLLRGSYQHLKAFVRILSQYDASYEPQVLTQEEFDAILETSNGQGKGNGQKGGKGKQGSNGNQSGNGNRGGNSGQGSGDGTGTCVNG